MGSPGASEGKSLTFFDPAARRWHQTWIDNAAQPLYLDGNFDSKSLVLTGRTGQGAAIAQPFRTVSMRFVPTPCPPDETLPGPARNRVRASAATSGSGLATALRQRWSVPR